MSTDPSAFWLYPDWEGPIKEPFWMRPPNFDQPEEPRIATIPPPPPPTPKAIRDALWDQATHIGFGCHNWRPRNPLCRMLGRHVGARMGEIKTSPSGHRCESWASAPCCDGIHGAVWIDI